ncbi:Alcohol dehydrogenase 2 [Endocarpon pusillum Z07020]|uniref:Alcohol dehydrogenase 2 n=1 Tax=Endocarpon pusillum (strain Z07020 / HMAS-L-300199) TaxID=1263415 RepID=U1I3I2_ENDPU|nr:Alcohol dehydrogenase 2 [Endocarpon pusillum Z07020]ERF76589.1 Alcohol dehydrogenase 2 [Endocarpon pusillum Z07020]
MGSVEVPKKHKACVYDKPGTISIKVEEIDTPEPGTGEVLWPMLPYPTQPGQIGGHEGVGTIASFGPGNDSSPLKIGDRVGIKWVASACGSCPPCFAGVDASCTSGKVSGYYYPGTFQQYALAPAHYVTPIPEGVASDLAAPMLCGGLTVYSALKKCRAGPGEWVVIAGASGGLGHLAVQIAAKGMGFRVIGTDVGEKEKFVKDCGAEFFLDVSKFEKGEKGTQDMVKQIRDLAGGFGAAAVLLCAASNAAYAQALDFLRYNGTLVCLGIPEHDPQPIATACPDKLVLKQLSIVGSAVGGRKEAIETLEMAARGVVKTHFRVEKMEGLAKVFEEMDEGKLMGRVVLDLS